MNSIASIRRSAQITNQHNDELVSAGKPLPAEVMLQIFSRVPEPKFAPNQADKIDQYSRVPQRPLGDWANLRLVNSFFYELVDLAHPVINKRRNRVILESCALNRFSSLEEKIFPAYLSEMTDFELNCKQGMLDQRTKGRYNLFEHCRSVKNLDISRSSHYSHEADDNLLDKILKVGAFNKVETVSLNFFSVGLPESISRCSALVSLNLQSHRYSAVKFFAMNLPNLEELKLRFGAACGKSSKSTKKRTHNDDPVDFLGLAHQFPKLRILSLYAETISMRVEDASKFACLESLEIMGVIIQKNQKRMRLQEDLSPKISSCPHTLKTLSFGTIDFAIDDNISMINTLGKNAQTLKLENIGAGPQNSSTPLDLPKLETLQVPSDIFENECSKYFSDKCMIPNIKRIEVVKINGMLKGEGLSRLLNLPGLDSMHVPSNQLKLLYAYIPSLFTTVSKNEIKRLDWDHPDAVLEWALRNS